MKLSPSEKSFTLIYTVIVLMELFSSQLQDLLPFSFSPKPLILVSLIIFYAMNCKSLDSRTNLLMILALNFSLAGDILLMFVDIDPNMFIASLVAFLLAHVMYVFTFKKKTHNSKPSIPLLGLLLAYALVILLLLKDGLGDLTIPVIIYMIVILAMVVFASLRKANVSNISYGLVLLGAIFFIISDSILAINKFYEPVVYSHFLIMGTYTLAQYLIVMGMLRQED
jgi:uncharacterized membrane protein YhhN